MSQATQSHQKQAQSHIARCAVLTISDTRTPETDKSGQRIRALLDEAGHQIADHAIVKDDVSAIEASLRQWLRQADIDVICTTGGTGIAGRDTTISVVQRLVDKELPGFGELFRMLSWQQIQAAAMLSCATAGLAGRTLLFAMPGSVHAVELAMTKLIVPELAHLIWETRRGR